jgi:hypothetical protein
VIECDAPDRREDRGIGQRRVVPGRHADPVAAALVQRYRELAVVR